MAVYCSRCGTGMPDNARYCSNCGSLLAVPQNYPRRPLVRPRTGRHIAGVCVGLAQAYGWDVALVRIFAVIGLFCSIGLVAIAYLACWIGIPEEIVTPPTEYPPTV
jgi:phage shock protein C